MVEQVVTGDRWGTDAFIAYDRPNKTIAIGIAGTNGFGRDPKDTPSDVLRMGSDQVWVVAAEIVRQVDAIALSDGLTREQILPQLTLVIGGQSLVGGAAKLLTLALKYCWTDNNGVRQSGFDEATVDAN